MYGREIILVSKLITHHDLAFHILYGKHALFETVLHQCLVGTTILSYLTDLPASFFPNQLSAYHCVHPQF